MPRSIRYYQGCYTEKILGYYIDLGRGQRDEQFSGVDVGKSTYLALCSLHTGQSRVTKWWAFATYWIPVLKERRTSRRERERQPFETKASRRKRNTGQRVLLC